MLFVCLGNICRSPLAEGVFRRLVVKEGLSDRIEVDSAGTGAWHVGEQPDRRMRSTAESHGVSLDAIRARRVEAADLVDFDYVFAMDRENLRDLRRLAGRSEDSIALFRAFDPVDGDPDVPDPYYGGTDGFERVFEIVERTSRSILDHIRSEQGWPTNDQPASGESDRNASA